MEAAGRSAGGWLAAFAAAFRILNYPGFYYMPFDSTLPVANAPVSSSELRNQFNGLQSNIQGRAYEDDCVNRFYMCAVNPAVVEGLGMVVGDPPSAGQVQAIADKLDELIAVLKRPVV